MKTRDILLQEMTLTELRTAQDIINRSWASLGIKVIFSKHALGRAMGRDKEITMVELVTVFNKVKEAHGQEIRAINHHGEVYQSIIKDRALEVNIPFVIRYDKPDKRGQVEMICQTVMRKPIQDFYSNQLTDKELFV
jgi:hypothetical protein